MITRLAAGRRPLLTLWAAGTGGAAVVAAGVLVLAAHLPSRSGQVVAPAGVAVSLLAMMTIVHRTAARLRALTAAPEDPHTKARRLSALYGTDIEYVRDDVWSVDGELVTLPPLR